LVLEDEAVEYGLGDLASVAIELSHGVELQPQVV